MIGGFGKTTLPAFGVRAALGGFAVLAGLVKLFVVIMTIEILSLVVKYI